MIEKHINKLNINSFLSGIVFKAFYAGYNEKECPLLIHYVILPMVLYGDLRKSLLAVNKNITLTNFVSQNKIHLIDFQQNLWSLKKLTNQSLIILHNKQSIILKDQVKIIETTDYNSYNEDIKKYLRASNYLGLMLKKEAVEDVYKILKVIP